MLLADDKGATLIVAVGTHATLVEFLDKGRGGMASTFLTRLRLGGKLIDAKGVNRLYRSRISSGALLLLVLAAMIAIGAALAVSTAGQAYLDIFGDKLGPASSTGYRAFSRDLLPLPPGLHHRGLPGAGAGHRRRHHRPQRRRSSRPAKQVKNLRGETASLRTSNDALSGTAANDEKFASQYMKPILAGRLTGKTVAIISAARNVGQDQERYRGRAHRSRRRRRHPDPADAEFIDPARASDIVALISGPAGPPFGLRCPIRPTRRPWPVTCSVTS